LELEILIKEARKGSQAAQKCLFDRFAASMMSVCCRYLKDTQEAEEALLDGFQNVFTSLSRFNYENEAAACGWIKKIMVNQCLMRLRKQRVFAMSTEGTVEEPAVGETAFSKMEVAEIYRAIMQLPPGYRTVFNLYEIEGYGHAEIARQLNITEGASKSQLHKAKTWLKNYITQTGLYEQRKIK
jgi:RNA polymerase sigma factor (sigma-70 family)